MTPPHQWKKRYGSLYSFARAEAEWPNAVPVVLMNGDWLVTLLVEHSIGVRRTSHYLLELGEPEDE